MGFVDLIGPILRPNFFTNDIKEGGSSLARLSQVNVIRPLKDV